MSNFKSNFKSYDLTIIGAGIIGSLAAYEITKLKPNWQVLLIDSSMIGHGATQYSLGVQFPYGRTAAKKQLTEQSLKIWETLISKIPNLPIRSLPFIGITQQSNLQLVLNGFVDPIPQTLKTSELARFKKTYPWIVLNPDQALIGGTQGSYANALGVTSLICEVLRTEQNSDIYEGIKIQKIKKQDDNLYGLLTSTQELISSKRILIATGPWLVAGLVTGLDSMKPIIKEKNIRTKKIVSLHINRIPNETDPIIFFFDEQAFLLPDINTKQWLFSFTAEEWDCEPNVQKLVITKEDQILAFSILEKYCPTLIEHCRGGRVFCDAYDSNLTPLIFEMSDMPNIIVAGAGAGSGFRLGPAIAKTAISKVIEL